jgi:hypothetical protein
MRCISIEELSYRDLWKIATTIAAVPYYDDENKYILHDHLLDLLLLSS